MARYSDYDNFAWLYNKEWTFFGDNIFPGLKAIAGDTLPDGARILDLCCGTGQLAKVLTEKGYQVTGIDGSARMLRYARKNAPGARFMAKDARFFRLSREYDAAFSTFDALNHVMTLKELERVFDNVFTCLVSGGIFIFDMTTQKHFEVITRNFKDIREKPGFLFFMRTDYDAEKKLGQWKMTLFRREGKLWKRSEIVLYQTWYPIAELKSSLEMAGFTGIRAHSFNLQRELEEGTEEADRVFFYAQKP
jgi:SAM-dependent methyltransferase